MASKKLELSRHILYLEARRSGAEWCIDKVLGENNKARIRDFTASLTTSIQENRAKLAFIEQEEAEMKAAEKARKADVHKNFGIAK